ncbi:unnamed protein product [Pocillopora meandrina]|uniref:Ig-like domain-containing protein n=1 Tax=Pocillopora meandrina TaxID=46732 RepID=A0AAU9W749_9CNID|nr:unnamed protein product [Pocillopora meandrina]
MTGPNSIIICCWSLSLPSRRAVSAMLRFREVCKPFLKPLTVFKMDLKANYIMMRCTNCERHSLLSILKKQLLICHLLNPQPVQSVRDPKNQSTINDFTVNFTYTAKDRLKPNISCVRDNDPYYGQSNQRAKDRWNLSIVIGSDLILNCITTGHPPGHPQSDIRWTKHNVSYDVQSRLRAKITRVRRDQTIHHQLFIAKVKKEDGGKYQCVASNIAGEKASIEVNLHVNDLDPRSDSRTLTKRTGLPILQLTVIAFVVSAFVFAIGAFLLDRRLVKQGDIHESPPKAREAWSYCLYILQSSLTLTTDRIRAIVTLSSPTCRVTKLIICFNGQSVVIRIKLERTTDRVTTLINLTTDRVL